MGRRPTGSVRRTRSGTWQARVSHLGRQVAIGTYPTRREATVALAAVHADAARGLWVDPAGGRLRVADVAERWWQTRTGHRLATRVRDREILDHDVLPDLGRAQLAELTREAVQDWVNALAVGWAPSTVRRSYTVLHQILGFAVDEGLLPASPAQRVRLPRPRRYEARFLTPDELEALENAIAPAYRAMVLTMAWATLRLGEAAGLRRADLDLRSGRLRVANNLVEILGQLHEGPPKTAAGRRAMTLPASVVAELRGHVMRYAGAVYVFPAPEGGPLHAEHWRATVWRPAVARAGLTRMRPHDLKHTGVALLAAAGVDAGEIARRAGHADPGFTLAVYGHLFPEGDRNAARKLDALRTTRLDKEQAQP